MQIKDHFNRLGSPKSFERGETVFFQEEVASHIGLITSGSASAKSYLEDGTQTWLSRFEEGELIGHISILSGQALRYEVSADDKMSVIFVQPAVLLELLEDNNILGTYVAKDLAEKMDRMTLRLIEAYTLTSQGRICAELMRLSSPMGIESDKTLIRPNPVFTELAMRVNSTRETVSRTVSNLQQKGILTREPGAILIHNPQALKSAIK